MTAEIPRFKADALIPEDATPGIYSGVDDSVYHGKLHLRSASDIKRMLKGARAAKQEAEAPKDPTAAMQLGTKVHMAVLEPNKFFSKYTCDYEPFKNDGRTKAGKAERQQRQEKALELETKGLTLLQVDEMEHILRMQKAVHEHPVAGKLIDKCECREEVIVWEHNGVKRKSKIDLIWIEGQWCADLKTGKDVSPHGFNNSIWYFGYDIQAAYYLAAVKSAGLDINEFAFLCVENAISKKYPEAAVLTMSKDWLEIGAERWEKYEQELQVALTTEQWDYQWKKETTLSPQSWMEREFYGD